MRNSLWNLICQMSRLTAQCFSFEIENQDESYNQWKDLGHKAKSRLEIRSRCGSRGGPGTRALEPHKLQHKNIPILVAPSNSMNPLHDPDQFLVLPVIGGSSRDLQTSTRDDGLDRGSAVPQHPHHSDARPRLRLLQTGVSGHW